MSVQLEQLTKEDLIKVIATMHDTIQDWDGWGLQDAEFKVIVNVGSACIKHCSEKNDFNLPNLES